VTIAYLVSKYPAVSHTFIRREVEGLRKLGFNIYTFSIHQPSLKELKSPEDINEYQTTTSIFPFNFAALLKSQITAIFQFRKRYFTALAVSLKLQNVGLKGRIWPLFHFIEAIFLAKTMAELGVTHIHSHFANSGSNVGLIASKLLDVSWSLTLHGLSDYGEPVLNHLQEKVDAAKFVICVSDYGRSQIMRITDPCLWNKIQVCHCGIDVEQFKTTTRIFNNGKNPFRLLCVARLSVEKGHIGLIEALKQVIDAGYKAELHLIGDGPELNNIQEHVLKLGLQECCILYGALGGKRIIEELSRSDAFVLGSFMEGLPVVLMEAMAAGLPVIAPRVAGIPELVVENTTGLLYTPGCWDQLGDAIIKLIKDDILAQALSIHGQEMVSQKFNISHSAAFLASIFRA
jgi:glycosyltransferase involved in cell wall biosynthesis